MAPLRTSPAPTRELHKTLGPRASVVHGELSCNLPESTEKCLPCKHMPCRDNKLSGQRADPSILEELRFPTDSSKLHGCGSKLDTSSLSSLPLLLSGSPSRAARARTPRTPPPHPLGEAGGPSPTPPQPVPGRAVLSRAPREAFLESRRAPGCALLTCAFFIRKGSAVIQPRQRCGESV